MRFYRGQHRFYGGIDLPGPPRRSRPVGFPSLASFGNIFFAIAPTERCQHGFINVRTAVAKGTGVSEPDLVQRAGKGDRCAFAALVDLYWDRLYRWLVHLAHDMHLAEDVAQESFLKAFTALPSFRGTAFRCWLFRIGYNTLLHHLKSRARVAPSLPSDVASSEPEPVEQAMDHETLERLAHAMGQLPGEYRAALLLRVEENLTGGHSLHQLTSGPAGSVGCDAQTVERSSH